MRERDMTPVNNRGRTRALQLAAANTLKPVSLSPLLPPLQPAAISGRNFKSLPLIAESQVRNGTSRIHYEGEKSENYRDPAARVAPLCGGCAVVMPTQMLLAPAL